jgi:hypothetical protein
MEDRVARIEQLGDLVISVQHHRLLERDQVGSQLA